MDTNDETFECMMALHAEQVRQLRRSENPRIAAAADLILSGRFFLLRGLPDSARSRFDHAKAALTQADYLGPKKGNDK